MPSNKKTRKFNMYANGKYYTGEEILQYFSASEAQTIFNENEGAIEDDPEDEVERLQQKPWCDKI